MINYSKNFYEPLEISRFFDRILLEVASCVGYPMNEDVFDKRVRSSMTDIFYENFAHGSENNHGNVSRQVDLDDYIFDWLIESPKGALAFEKTVLDKIVNYLNKEKDTDVYLEELREYLLDIHPKFVKYIEQKVNNKLSKDWYSII